MQPIEIRPWGSYQVLLDEPTCKVKKIILKKDHRLSLQRHHKRSETWTCISGNVGVTYGRCLDQLITQFIVPGTTIHIPHGYLHRAFSLEGDSVFIEVQTGTYFGEDDIERILDDYGRYGSEFDAKRLDI
jgi:mannose-6-phosphate isomerase-like protein (cupin superfamily)